MKYSICVLFVLFFHAPVSAQPAYRIVSDIPGDAAYADSVIQVTDARLRELIGPFEFDSLAIYIVTSEKRFDTLSGGSVPVRGADRGAEAASGDGDRGGDRDQSGVNRRRR